MCGIFGSVAETTNSVSLPILKLLSSFSTRRGVDGSGSITFQNGSYQLHRSSLNSAQLFDSTKSSLFKLYIGHSRLVTSGNLFNQPINTSHSAVVHNGIITNCSQLWNSISSSPSTSIDTEIIPNFFDFHLARGLSPLQIAKNFLNDVTGVVNCAIVLPSFQKLLLFSNNGSLYYTSTNNQFIFSSEKSFLSNSIPGINESSINQLRGCLEIPIPSSISSFKEFNDTVKHNYVVPIISSTSIEESILRYDSHNLQRCTKCILPNTMPFIEFDENGVCNYCRNYIPKNRPKPLSELLDLISKYRVGSQPISCIVPFSGGRDSTYTLHYLKKVLKLDPIAYTYDWGMVTDLGRRNISRVCAELSVENITVAANIRKKRAFIRKNLSAFLHKPDLAMLNILTAGDKHFFRHVNTICRETLVPLNIWGISPLEITHFKSGFLGIKPQFSAKKNYHSGFSMQLYYQLLRLRKYVGNTRYFNNSIFDNLYGEYYRSVHKKKDYAHFFDYVKWDEQLIDRTIIDNYDWETSDDTSTTWRIGDATAAFYNYVNYFLAGFTEHDTFRSNQIREGDISRSEALRLVNLENRPRYPNIKWYLDILGFDFTDSIKAIHNAPRLYE